MANAGHSIVCTHLRLLIQFSVNFRLKRNHLQFDIKYVLLAHVLSMHV